VLTDLPAKLKRDRVMTSAAALAFYWMLALFPAAIFVLTLLPYLPVTNLEHAIMEELSRVMPKEVAILFEDTVRNVVSSRKAGLLSFGFLFTVWTASTGMLAVIDELNNVHGVTENRPFWKVQALALILTFAEVSLVLGSLALVVAGDAIADWLGTTFAIVRWVIVGVALPFALALLYNFAPAARARKFALLTPGTIAGTVALALASLAFKTYVAHFQSYDKMYGSLGAVIAMLVWLYVTGLVLLVGAEIDELAAHRLDSSAASRPTLRAG
jgi:membrane protein